MSHIIQRGKPKDAVVRDPWWQQSVVAAATVGEFEFWVLILEEGKGEF